MGFVGQSENGNRHGLGGGKMVRNGLVMSVDPWTSFGKIKCFVSNFSLSYLFLSSSLSLSLLSPFSFHCALLSVVASSCCCSSSSA